MLLLALFLVAISTIADFIGAGIVVWKLYRPEPVRLVINFAIGILLALSFVHFLPEALEQALELGGDTQAIFLSALVGIVLAFLFERMVAWYHCHDEECRMHSGSPGKKITLLAGSSFEEFIDGAAIGFAVVSGIQTQNPALIFLTTLAVFAHEFPETISKVITLSAFGLTPKRAMAYILATAMAGFPGAAAALFIGEMFNTILPIFLAFVAGLFFYIAAADLIPEVHRSVRRGLLLGEIASLFMGIIVVLTLGFLH